VAASTFIANRLDSVKIDTVNFFPDLSSAGATLPSLNPKKGVNVYHLKGKIMPT
jgi:hypothetical protein